MNFALVHRHQQQRGNINYNDNYNRSSSQSEQEQLDLAHTVQTVIELAEWLNSSSSY